MVSDVVVFIVIYISYSNYLLSVSQAAKSLPKFTIKKRSFDPELFSGQYVIAGAVNPRIEQVQIVDHLIKFNPEHLSSITSENIQIKRHFLRKRPTRKFPEANFNVSTGSNFSFHGTSPPAFGKLLRRRNEYYHHNKPHNLGNIAIGLGVQDLIKNKMFQGKNHHDISLITEDIVNATQNYTNSDFWHSKINFENEKSPEISDGILLIRNDLDKVVSSFLTREGNNKWFLERLADMHKHNESHSTSETSGVQKPSVELHIPKHNQSILKLEPKYQTINIDDTINDTIDGYDQQYSHDHAALEPRTKRIKRQLFGYYDVLLPGYGKIGDTVNEFVELILNLITVFLHR